MSKTEKQGFITEVKDVKIPKEKPGLKVQTTEPGPPKRITVLAYGASGSGKTHFAGTFPKPLFLDMRGGLMTIRAKKVKFIRPKSYADMLLPSIAENVEPYETIVFDHMTEAARLLMVQALMMSGRERPQLQDWQLVIERMRRLVVAYTSDDTLPDKHILFVCEDQIDKNDETGEVLVTPDVPGKFARQIGSWFDCIFHLRNCYNSETKTKGRWMLTEPEGMYPAKDRTGCLSKLEVPDFEIIWKKISP